MEEDLLPSPLKNFTPRGNPPAAQPAVESLPNLSDDDLRHLAREKLSALLQSLDPKTSPSLLLSAVREVMDRLNGKPRQQIDTTLKGEMVTTIQIVRFSDLPQDVVIEHNQLRTTNSQANQVIENK